jgi:hypothetical protein
MYNNKYTNFCFVRGNLASLIPVTVAFKSSTPPPAVAQWLRYCATNQKVAGSISDGVIGIFHWHKSFWLHYGPGVDSAFNRNEYQEYFLGVNAAGV